MLIEKQKSTYDDVLIILTFLSFDWSVAMPSARYKTIRKSETKFYHCISRCVRRGFLFGIDSLTKKNFDHRRDWLVDRFHFLSQVFCIKICGYAVMSNHYHLILMVDEDALEQLSENEIFSKWRKICKQGKLTHQDIEIIKERLTSISWYMKYLNEYIARKANKEDQCKGHFWESRFKCHALLDEEALLSCMAYVDLNPVRAKVAETPEASDFTSVQQRIEIEKNPTKKLKVRELAMVPFQSQDKQINELPIQFEEYLELLDYTGRVQRAEKKGSIEHSLPPILQRLEISSEHWKQVTSEFSKLFSTVVGKASALNEFAGHINQQWLKGVRKAKILFKE